MFKRGLCVVLTVLLVLGTVFLAGCQNDNEKTETEKTQKTTAGITKGTQEAEATKSEEPVSLKYWYAARWKGITGEEENGQLGDWQKSVAQEFMNQNPNVTDIQCEHVAFGDMLEKVTVAVEANNPPDVVEDGTARFFTYAEKGALVPLDSYFTEEELSDYKEGIWDLCKYRDGKHYMVPWGGTVVHPVVNIDLFKEAGALDLLPLEGERRWTMDEFKEACAAVSKLDGVYGTAFYCGSEQGDSGTNALYWGYGASLFNDDCTEAVFNSPEAIKGVQWAVDMVNEGLAAPSAESMVVRDTFGLFINQKIAIYLNGYSGIDTRIATELEAGGFESFEVQQVLPPSAPGVDPAYYSSTAGLAVFKSGNENQEKIAVELAKFATNTENSKALEIIGWIPIRKSVGNLYTDSYHEWANEVVKYGKDPGLASPAYAEFRAYLYPELQAIYTGAKTVEEGLNEVVDKVNGILSEKLNK